MSTIIRRRNNEWTIFTNIHKLTVTNLNVIKIDINHNQSIYRKTTQKTTTTVLTLSMLGNSFSRRHFEIFYLLFLQIGFDIPSNLHVVSELIFWGKYFKMSFAELAHSMVSANFRMDDDNLIEGTRGKLNMVIKQKQ